MTSQDAAKLAAAQRAVSQISDGQNIGLGSGSTVDFAIQVLGQRVYEGLNIRIAVASNRSEAAARNNGLTLSSLCDLARLDLVIDGTDEFDTELNLIKGGGGALVREKLLARAADELIIVADETKAVQQLGRFPLPVAVLPFGARQTLQRLQVYCPESRFRESDGKAVETDDGFLIVTMPFGSIDDAPGLERALKGETGVVEVGLFVGLTTRVFRGSPDGSTVELLSDRAG